MAHVTVTINGKTYRMACDEGEESHLLSLADRFNDYVSDLKGAFGEIGDQRLTVMAGIMVTDAMQEMEKRLHTLEADMSTLKASRDQALGKSQEQERDLTAQLGQAADRIEQIAARLTRPASPGNAKRN
jgi:cell division protein ZapA